MRKILDPDETTIKLCGSQRLRSDTDYRLSAQCMQVSCDEGTILYHTMTGAMYLLPSDEKASKYLTSGKIEIYSQVAETPDPGTEELLSHWFIVPEDFNEKKQVDDLRRVAAVMKPKEDAITGFTVFTTTDCNARCFYCYENGIRKLRMTPKTAEDVADYIIGSCKGKPIKLTWFGGEPFYNTEAIEIICRKLRLAGIEYTSTSTSNGYFLDRDTSYKAKTDWHLKAVQISIDGTEEIYNRTKDYTDCEGSAFERVTDNIKNLQDEGVHVTIRLNIHKGNADDLMKLLDDLSVRLNGYSDWHIHVVPVKSPDGKGLLYEDEVELEEHTARLNEKIKAMGVSVDWDLARGIVGNRCIADNDDCEVIYPDGTTGRCEHYNENEITGSIYTEKRDASITASWKERLVFEECAKCPMYPQCINLKKCFWKDDHCSDNDRRRRTDRLKNLVMETYIKEQVKRNEA